MNHRNRSTESVIIIVFALSIYTTISQVRGAGHDDAMRALNSRILKEIKFNREMVSNKCKEDNSISSRHTDDGKTQKKVVSEIKKEITDAIVKILYDELKQVTQIETLQKRVIIESVKNKERNDKVMIGVPPVLGLKRDDVVKSIDLKQVKDISKSDLEKENGPPGLWGKDEVHGPPGLWGKDDIRGPPGLWGKRAVSLGPPGLWGKEVIKTKRVLSDTSPPGLWGRDERIDNEKWLLSKGSPPGLWGKEAETKINLSENKGNFDDSISNDKDN